MAPADVAGLDGWCSEEQWEAFARDVDESWSPWARFAHLFAFDDDEEPPSDVELLRRMRDCEALVTQLTARQGRDLIELRRRRLDRQGAEHQHDGPCRTACCDPHGWVTTEVGVELGLSERQVTARIETAESLCEHVHVAEAVEQGRLQVWTATRLLDHLDMLATLLPHERVDRIEAATVAWLLERPRTVSQLSARMRRLLLAARSRDGIDPDPGACRRQVVVQPGQDVGMAEVRAVLPEPDALAVRAWLGSLGAEAVAEDDTRTVGQRRADLLVALVTGAPACHGHPEDVAFAMRPPGEMSVRADVTVPAATLTGRLLGFGAPVTWLRELPPSSGYQHSPALDTAIRLRDRHCRAPGCTRPAARCDCDHVVPYPRGETTLANGCCLCRRHHRLKTHAPGWGLAACPDGSIRWTTPTGRTVTTTPGDYSPVEVDVASEADVPPF